MGWEKWFDAYLDAAAAGCHIHVHGSAVRARLAMGIELEPIDIRAEKVWRHARKIYAFNNLNEERNKQ